MAGEREYDDAGADGGDGAVAPEQLQGLKDAAAEWNGRSEEFWQRRLEAENARKCRWQGQSADGRLWADNFGGRVPSPFDGASDQRVRWADALVREKVNLMLVAMQRAQPRCEGRGKGDAERARKSTALLRWMIDRLGLEWLRQWAVALNYAWADSPAVAMIGVEWAVEAGTEMRSLTAQGLADLYAERAAQGGGADPQMIALAAEEFRLALFSSEAEEEALAEMVIGFFPDLRPARARKIVRQLRREGEAEFPYPVTVYEGPRVRAMRYGDDFIIPDNSKEFKRATPWFASEWLTEQDLRARAAEGWDAAFVEDVLEHEGVACFSEWQEAPGGALWQIGPERYKGLYQVVTAYYIGLDEDDSPARYMTVFHTGSDRTAYGRRMIRDAHGDWPAVVYQTDVTDGFLLNAEGIPERVSPLQSAMKAIIDNGTDANAIWSLPPILSVGIEQHGDAYLEPLKVIRGKRDAKFEAMRGPQAPTQGAQVERQLERLRDWAHGRPNADDADGGQGAATAREAEVVWFLSHVRDCCRMMLALARQYATDELLARVTDSAGDALIRSREDIAGEFDVRLVFDPADLDLENMGKRLQMVRDLVMVMDQGKAINAAVVAQASFRAVFPYMAEDAVRDLRQADGDELKDEANNYALLRAGVMPTLDTDGNWNYGLRREWYDRLSEANPTVFEDMGEDKRALLQQWLAGLEQQATQYGANVEIGKTGMAGGGAAGDGGNAER